MRQFFFFLISVCALGSFAAGQSFGPRALDGWIPSVPAYNATAPRSSTPDISAPVALPRMAPELALQIYQLKPRSKRPGLFKGRIYLDAHTGSLVRAEGSVVKSPSFFVKKIDFVQDYADVDNFTFPVHIHTNALARVIGRTVVDIFHR